jgi:hypothetical protein
MKTTYTLEEVIKIKQEQANRLKEKYAPTISGVGYDVETVELVEWWNDEVDKATNKLSNIYERQM